MRPSTASSSSASAFDRKPTLPRLMPRIGTSTSATARAARRNVPSPPSTTSDVGRRQLARAASSMSPAGACPLRRCRASGTSRRPARAARRRPRSSGCRRSRSRVGHRSRPGRSTVVDHARRSRRSRARPRGGRGTRGCPPARGSATAMTSRVPSPSVAARRRRPARGPRDGSPGRGRRRGRVRPAPASNCGLTSATIVAAPARASSATGPRTRPSEMNDTSIDGEVDRLGQRRRRSASGRSSAPSRRPAGRGAATRRAGRARRRERRRGVAPRCSRTSVKPPVEAPTSSADAARRVDLERVERGGELVAARG